MVLSEKRPAFTALPDPTRAVSVDDLVERLRLLKTWAGNPSYAVIKDRVNAAWASAGRPAGELTHKPTVAHCFRPGRRRLNTDLVLAVVQALHADPGYVAQWRQAMRVVDGESQAASQVRVHGSLPPDLARFTGRSDELRRLRAALRRAARAGEPVVAAIEGMAGVGKTRLAIHAGHVLHQREPFDRVLFVNLRGFHPDPNQPPADPAAVLDGFLRLIGMNGYQIPHGLGARVAAYRRCLAGQRVLVILDNAASAEHVRPLMPAGPGCLTLVTSRCGLAGLRPAARLTIDVLNSAEATTFLAEAVPEVPAGADPGALDRIARRCGRLPLALTLIAGHIRAMPGWTLTDHADRLDERHRECRLDAGVELALDLSYRRLPADRRRLLRVLALHPGEDFDAYAAAALTAIDPRAAEAGLADLHSEHLLQRAHPGRYTFHDLVHAFAAVRAHDENPPSERRDALTRLFGYYLATTTAAMNTLYPAEARYRPQTAPAAEHAPDVAGHDAAIAWLETERVTLVAVTAHTAGNGWPGHGIDLARALFRHLNTGYFADALSVQTCALRAASGLRDLRGQADALLGMGIARASLGRPGQAAEDFRQALDGYRRTGDLVGQALSMYRLGSVTRIAGHGADAVEHFRQALVLHRRAGDRTGEAMALVRLGGALHELNGSAEAIERCRRGLALTQQIGHGAGEAYAPGVLGELETVSGQYGPASDRLYRALALVTRFGIRSGEAGVLDALGLLHLRLGRLDQAGELFRRSLTIFRGIGHRNGQATAHNGLAETVCAAGRAAEALTHHTAAHAIAVDIGSLGEQARAHAGLGNAYRAAGDTVRAQEHYLRARALFADLGRPETETISAGLGELEAGG
ncbi:tetratricopeptide repeat protein [Actinoplanes sp. NPDC048796]|uniref:tetratricopeptide repeat protein n=1 Tax=Actinoplanes sp. NPDC048796 TaxID=3155640 RepID=UPI0033E8BE51